MRNRTKLLGFCLALATLLGIGPAAESQTLRERLAERRTTAGADLPPGVERGSIVAGGRNRYFLYYVPEGRSARPALVLALHGGRGESAMFLETTRSLLDHADSRGFIAVYPDGNGNWNDGRANFADRPSDIPFMRGIVDYMARRHGVDRSRVFVTGVSNGGAMSFKIACDAADLVAGIAPINSSLTKTLHTTCRPGRPVPVVMFNGTEDPLNVYQGGKSTSRLARNAPQEDTLIGVVATAEYWAQVNGCSTGSTKQGLADRFDDGTTVSLLKYCSRVWLYRVEGGGHTVPGSASRSQRAERLVGRTSREIDAVERAVAFFTRFGL